MLGYNIDLRFITANGESIQKLFLIKKICDTKTTNIFLAYHEPTASLYCIKKSFLGGTK